MTFSEKRTEKLSKLVFLNMFENRQTLRKIWTSLNNCLWSNQWNGGYIIKNSFSPQSKPHTAKLCFSVVLKHFRWNSQRTSLFIQKVDISERRTEILTKFVFLNMFENGKILKKIWMYLNSSFWSNQWKGTNIKKKVFSPKVSHISKSMFFCCFVAFSWKFTRILVLVQKFTISGKSTEILRFVFLNMFENGKILRKNWICLNNCFWSNEWKRKNIKKNSFSP